MILKHSGVNLSKVRKFLLLNIYFFSKPETSPIFKKQSAQCNLSQLLNAVLWIRLQELERPNLTSMWKKIFQTSEVTYNISVNISVTVPFNWSSYGLTRETNYQATHCHISEDIFMVNPTTDSNLTQATLSDMSIENTDTIFFSLFSPESWYYHVFYLSNWMHN